MTESDGKMEEIYSKIDPDWRAKLQKRYEEMCGRLELRPRTRGAEIIGGKVDVALEFEVVLDGDVILSISQQHYDPKSFKVLVWPDGDTWVLGDAEIRCRHDMASTLNSDKRARKRKKKVK